MARDSTHRVSMLAYPDAQILDITGPLEVFSRTARWLKAHGRTRNLFYRLELLASEPGPVRTSSGLEIVAARSYRDAGRIDTLFVTGGIGYEAVMEDEQLLKWIRQRRSRVKRLGSICTGALILGKAGLLDGMAATTHWSYCDRLAESCPDVAVNPDAIFVRNGNLYTSAGVTAGMDMALAMVEEDWGRDVALAVAQELVMYLKRPGGQSQFSSHIAAQHTGTERFRTLQYWILDHLDKDLQVSSLASRAAMSPRNFARAFLRETGSTPARFVEKSRLEAARRKLEESNLGVDRIASQCGFGSAESMRRTFIRYLRVPPNDYRRCFQSACQGVPGAA